MTDISQRQRLDLYIDALNRDDLAGVAACYRPTLQLSDPQMEYHAADAALAFHGRFIGRVTQVLAVLNYVDRPGRIAAEIRWTLTAEEDVPDHPTGPLERGEERTWISFTMIDMAGGRFARIRSAPYHHVQNSSGKGPAPMAIEAPSITETGDKATP